MKRTLWMLVGATAALPLTVGGAGLLSDASTPGSWVGLANAVAMPSLSGVLSGRQPAGRSETDVPASFGSEGAGRYAPGRILVAPAAGRGAEAITTTADEVDATVKGRLPGTRVREVRLAPGQGVQQAIRRFERDPGIAYAEPDFVVAPAADAAVTPNDPVFPKLYGLNNTGQTGGTADADIDAPEAWSHTVGGEGAVVAVIDTGTDIGHPDLRDNTWTNPGEIAGNGIDDDANGYVDDVHGWDFAAGDSSVFDGAGDEHGTHVAGTIAATGGNGIGLTGVAWRAQLMPLKFLGPDGGFTSDAIAAINYAVANGAQVSNNSWGGGGYSRSLQEAIAAAGSKGHLFVTAAGNGGADEVGDDIDTSPDYPAAFPEPSIVSVAATDHTDALAAFSNFGAVGVDLAAPGVRVFSTLPNGSYGAYSGTSMAAPHVAGAAALLLSESPGLGALAVKEALLSSVDLVGALGGVVATGGRLNVGNLFAVEPVPEVSLTFTPPIVDFGSVTGVEGVATLEGEPVPDRVVTLEQRQAGVSTWSTVEGGATTAGDGTFELAELRPTANTDYRARLLGDQLATSVIQRVGVRALISNRTATTDLRLTQSRVLAGTVTPAHGGLVDLTVFRGSNRVLSTKVELVDSRFRYVYKPKRTGSYTVRATWAADLDHLVARSVARTFRVR